MSENRRGGGLTHTATGHVGELQTEKNSFGIARFPCTSTAFLFSIVMVCTVLMHMHNRNWDGSLVPRDKPIDTHWSEN